MTKKLYKQFFSVQKQRTFFCLSMWQISVQRTEMSNNLHVAVNFLSKQPNVQRVTGQIFSAGGQTSNFRPCPVAQTSIFRPCPSQKRRKDNSYLEGTRNCPSPKPLNFLSGQPLKNFAAGCSFRGVTNPGPMVSILFFPSQSCSRLASASNPDATLRI